jgi:hypothetical protein
MAAKTKAYAMVSERALIARINRKLKKDDVCLKKARGFHDANRGHWYPDSNLGWYYTVDFMRNAIVHTHLDLEAYGRELEVLAGWEKLEDDAE